MFKHILVTLDGSARAYDALELARALALQSHARITLLRVEAWGAPSEAVRKDHIDLEARVERLRADGIGAHAVVMFDEPEDGIVATTSVEEVDLVMLAPHLRDGLAAMTQPSVTARMLSRSPAPLLILPDGMPYIGSAPLLANPMERILLPLDGSERAEAALPLAMELARQYDRELLLARAVAPATYPTAPELYIPAGEGVMAYRQEAERYLVQTATRVRDAGLRARTLVLSGPAEAELTALLDTEPIGLVVLCTHGRTGAARLLLGSVARHLIYHATTPLIVLPPRYVAALGAPVRSQETPAR